MRRKRTEGTEDHEGESVADDPLSNGSDDHEDAAEEEVCSWTGGEVRLGLAVYAGEGRMYQCQKRRFHRRLSSP